MARMRDRLLRGCGVICVGLLGAFTFGLCLPGCSSDDSEEHKTVIIAPDRDNAERRQEVRDDRAKRRDESRKDRKERRE